MRDIKFRAWDKDTKEMFYPFHGHNDKELFLGFQSGGVLEVSKYMEKGSWWLMPLMQFTGLLDKTGAEIYEGDVLLWHEDVNMLVKWNELYASFILEDLRLKGMMSLDSKISTECYEVIGNIHENPELLTETV